jgi:outer membrane protein assembly factor BamB
VRADDGKVLWRHPWETAYQANIATPVVVGDYVFVSSGYNKGCTLLRLRADGSGVKAESVYFRSNRVMRTHMATVVYRDGFVYGFDDPAGLRCVDFRKGELVEDWEGRDADNKAINKGCLILAGDKLIGLTTTGTVFLADADPTEFKFRGKLDGVLAGGECWALPVLVDGRIYLRDAEKAVCLDVRPKDGEGAK